MIIIMERTVRYVDDLQQKNRTHPDRQKWLALIDLFNSGNHFRLGGAEINAEYYSEIQ